MVFIFYGAGDEARCRCALWAQRKVLIPSSRNQTTVHRTVVFKWFDPLLSQT